MKKTNIIIFCYNRPRHLKKLLLNLNKIKDRKFYIISDGPKSKSDKNLVDKVREKINNSNLFVAKRIYFKKNIGVRKYLKLVLIGFLNLKKK